MNRLPAIMVSTMATGRVTDEERDAIVATLTETENVRETARRHGRSKSCVSRIAIAEGLDTAGRPQTEKATAAAVEDNRARRARIETNYLEITELTQWVALTVDMAPRDLKDVVLSGAIAFDKAILVSRHDVKPDEGDQALLLDFVNGMRAAA